ncbi:hypothetical protein P7C73_g147, partial [Tremellales sp. Uapishka_1]
MHWRNYIISGSINHALNNELRLQAEEALAQAHSHEHSIGFSISSQYQTINGVSTASSEVRIGKGNPWNEAEVKALENRLVAVAPGGILLDGSGKPVKAIEGSK